MNRGGTLRKWSSGKIRVNSRYGPSLRDKNREGKKMLTERERKREGADNIRGEQQVGLLTLAEGPRE